MPETANLTETDIIVKNGIRMVLCPKCKTEVAVGNGGIGNFVKQHLGTKKCDKNRLKQHRNEASQHGMQRLTSFFTKHAKAPYVPSAVTAPAPVLPASSSSTPASAISDNLGTGGSNNTSPACTDGLKLIAQVRKAISQLPVSVPTAKPSDLIARCAVEPHSVTDDEAWEVQYVLDPLLNRLLGYGATVEEIARLHVRRGDLGLEALCRYVEHFVVACRVPGSLLEGRFSKLLAAIELMTPQSPTEYDTGLPPNDVDMRATSEVQPVTVDNKRTEVPANIAQSKSDDIIFIKRQRLTPCLGYRLATPEGKAAGLVYPFMLHDLKALPWDYESRNGVLRLRARNCEGRITLGESCKPCYELKNYPMLAGIEERIVFGVHENAPFAYHGCGGLVEIVRRKNTAIDKLRLRRLNDTRKLVGWEGKLEEHKRMLMAIASQKIPRVDRVLWTGFARNLGLHGMLALMKRAADGTYHPKGFDEEDDLQGLLMLRLGGSRVANIAQRMFGTPAASTIRQRTSVPSLLPSPAFPKTAEIETNVESCFKSLQDSTTMVLSPRIVHGVLMFDELAVERRPRWDDKSNKFLGLCREHADSTNLSFNTQDDLEALFDDIEEEEVHLAGEATVGALGLLSSEPRLYSARPVLVSGSCKHERAEQHARLLQTTMDGVNRKAELTHARIISLASDGEARRDDITPDKDYKHIFKRLCNALLREKGILIQGVWLTLALIRVHLRDVGLSSSHIQSAFNPEDKQDVALAYNLLKDLWNLPPTLSNRPGFTETRNALRIFGSLCFHLILPYICVDLTLSEQLEHLSSAAHLALALFAHGQARSQFIPTALYVDIMLMIKNAYFCVAKAKVDLPENDFFIILLGTDRLETLFGILRTMVGNDANLDVLQLALRLTGTTEVANILARHPEWDKAPRRLHLPSISKDMKVLPDAVDHINPRLWRGDTAVKNVVLSRCWKRGRRTIESSHLFIADVLDVVAGTEDASMLAPMGTLLVNVSASPEDNEDGDDTELSTEEPSDTTEGLRELEEAAVDAEWNSRNVTASFTRSIDADGSGKMVNKARALALRFKYKKSSNSTDRLRRVQQEGRYKSQQLAASDLASLNEGPSLIVTDPIATFLSCEQKQFLCIGEVIGIRFDSKAVDEIALELLPEKTVSVTFQVFRVLRASIDDDPELKHDWRSSRLLDGMDFKVSGILIQPINPVTATHIPSHPFHLFDSPTLMAMTSSLYDRLAQSDIELIPQIKSTAEFPYRESSGKACFVAERSGRVREPEPNSCPVCIPRVQLDMSRGQRVLEHIGSHILYDHGVDRNLEPCGLCLKPWPLCQFYLKKGKGQAGGITVDLKRSTCPNLLKFNYKTAADSKKASPCSNTPLKCPVCPSDKPAIWRYNLLRHLQRCHPAVSINTYHSLWSLSTFEETEMQKMWNTRQKCPKRCKNLKTAVNAALVISEAHSSRRTLIEQSDEEDFNSPDDGDDIYGGDYNDDEDKQSDAAYGPDDDGEQDMTGALEDQTLNGNDTFADQEPRDAVLNDNDVSVGTRDVGDERERGQHEGVSCSDTPDAGHVEPPSEDHGVGFNVVDVAMPHETPSGEAGIQNRLRDAPAVPRSLARAIHLGPANDNASAPLIDGRPTRSGRKRKERDLEGLSVCWCGERAVPSESAGDELVECKKAGCETVWYHVRCVNVDVAQKTWTCEACKAQTKGKRRRD